MLQDLDSTLETLLRRDLPRNLGDQRFSFATPFAEFIDNKPAFNLFLYDIRENLELRSNIGEIQPRGDLSAAKVRPDARVDCSYLITYWPKTASSPAEEHRYLGEVMKILLRYPYLPNEVLQGSLNPNSPEPPKLPLKMISLRPSQLQSVGEFWQAMGGKPKASLNCTVTLAVPVHGEPETLPLVRSRDFQVLPK
ncbi:DUF4255 domain-containing protein [Phormidium tenue]|uniref:Pvc16 N-terminal domain-containing protein n=1 Tax=Phormidium tenue NIES-30 TaxID=549789 RepID=A0A1U7IXX2_9CYAN|nr:DUF4255 domain-containing protein [Phormidium tenue]MBD2233309.1 DUF4255 domain-containing protein [Phormidium tenue FACHB-1052]OKH43262.1 hypothetical protein NIES30_25250 [Phormidium tenue NIES-30]